MLLLLMLNDSVKKMSGLHGTGFVFIPGCIFHSLFCLSLLDFFFFFLYTRRKTTNFHCKMMTLKCLSCLQCRSNTRKSMKYLKDLISQITIKLWQTYSNSIYTRQLLQRLTVPVSPVCAVTLIYDMRSSHVCCNDESPTFRGHESLCARQSLVNPPTLVMCPRE